MSNTLKFLLDGEPVEIDKVTPDRTVLQYLREDRVRTGSKEGCAEGDCGACTVVIAELDDNTGRIRYQAINACIQFLPTLDGKALITVESLSPAGGPLHPVQQAMVEMHGSQCGFCTPGFVMSLFALYKSEPASDIERLHEALAGNLCRCTGYRPIIDAGLRMNEIQPSASNPHSPWLDGPWQAALDAAERELIKRLTALKRSETLHASDDQNSCYSPISITGLDDLMQRHPDARLLAGGTDIGLWVTKLYRELETLVYLGDIPELRKIDVGQDFIEIGAMVSFSDAQDLLIEHFPATRELLLRFASPPIRNAATLGGNIANGSPIGDSMPLLIALGCEIVLRKDAQERVLPLDAFYLDYQKTARQAGEVLVRMRIPRATESWQLGTYKISKRFDQDISAVCAAFALDLDDGIVKQARIAFGGVAGIPIRASVTEKALIGKPWNDASIKAAQKILRQEFTPLSDMRASADYRREVAANLLQRFFIESTQPNIATRTYDFKSA